MKKMHFVRVVRRHKVLGYSRTYSSTTLCYVYLDGLFKADFVTSNYGGFTRCIDYLKRKFGNKYTYSVDKKGYSQNVNS